jgi:hypothetical protein
LNRIYDAPGNVVKTHEHVGDFSAFPVCSLHDPDNRRLLTAVDDVLLRLQTRSSE